MDDSLKYGQILKTSSISKDFINIKKQKALQAYLSIPVRLSNDLVYQSVKHIGE
ncbi:hypothetical protein [Tissierella praeacuta]|uniref:hypothetical protein n=1 Tax=Tissierella praeacuta TaxID=43131 RepID=UPI0028971D68|nr:hypothetical protein [Tissierella praeacuta]